MKRFVILTSATLIGCGPGAPANGRDSDGPSERGEVQSVPAGSFQAMSFRGDSLFAVPSAAAVESQEPLLTQALEDRANDPGDVDAWIWVGRRLGYLQRYREAIEAFGEAIERFPDDPRLLRHRGHRYLSVRRVDDAIRDFQVAAEMVDGQPDQVEPDGLPNERGIPTSTLQFNIWYHLGLSHFVKGQYEDALAAYRRGLEVSQNPDALVAMTYWTYLTLRRLDLPAEAAALLEPITSGMDIIENGSYHDLLLLYKGDRTLEDVAPAGEPSPSSSATLYGIANYHFMNDRDGAGLRVLNEMSGVESQWSAFGTIAAEADLARMVDGAPVGSVDPERGGPTPLDEEG